MDVDPTPTERAEDLVSRVVFAVLHREKYGDDLTRQRCDDLVAYVTELAAQRDRLRQYVQAWEYSDAFENERASWWEEGRTRFRITEEDVPMPTRT